MHGLKAVCKRQLMSFLASPIGYVFILVFVFLVNHQCFFPDAFYKRNVADLAMLDGVMPWFLVVLLSALAMNAWTQEREQGTEELLLTLPLSIWQAFFGKLLAVICLFSAALFCSMSSICVLWWLGNPDIGLLCANYLGWWFMGIGFAALSLGASVFLSNQTISFVCSIVVCSLALFVGQGLQWGEAANRGMFSLAELSLSITYVIIGASIGIMYLAARRSRAEHKVNRRWQWLTLIAALVISINLTSIGNRWDLNVDLTSEGLSSLSASSMQIVSEVNTPIALTVVISKDVPQELDIQSRELLDMCTALKQSMGGQLDLQIVRPDDPLTSEGRFVQDNYQVLPRETYTDTVAGRQAVSVFLGAFLQAGKATRGIPFFERGMSIEYELVRAIRALDQTIGQKQKIVGVVSTEIEMLEYYSNLSGQMLPAWKFIDELRQQYDVREVNPDMPIDKVIDVLIVPLPSGLTQEQLMHVHDHIWTGGKTLLLADPMPILIMEELQRYGIAMAPSLPRYDRYASESAKPEPKGQIDQLYKALGVEHANDQILWTRYKPDASLSNLPEEFVWLHHNVGSFADVSITKGLQTMMCIYPGYIRKRDGTTMNVETLAQVGAEVNWGANSFGDYMKKEADTFKFQTKVKRSVRMDDGPALAVSITGTMQRAFMHGDLHKGQESQAGAHVIIVADIDLAHDRFFTMAKRMNTKDSGSFQKIWASIRNVQFLSNAVDVLAGETDLLQLRQRHARYRSLARIDALRQENRDETLAIKDQLEKKVDKETQAIKETFEAQVLEISKNEHMDNYSKLNQTALLQKEHEGYLQRYSEGQNKSLAEAIKQANIEERRTIKTFQQGVSYMAIAIPSAVLLLLLSIVSIKQYRRERHDIPKSRLRAQT